MWPDGSRSIWAATDHGAARFSGGAWTAYTSEHGLPEGNASGLFQLSSGALLVGTSGGLARFENGAFVAEPVPPSLLGSRMERMAETPEPDGSTALWLATYGAGVACRRGGTWTVYDSRSGLPSDSTSVVIPSKADDGSAVVLVGAPVAVAGRNT